MATQLRERCTRTGELLSFQHDDAVTLALDEAFLHEPLLHQPQARALVQLDDLFLVSLAGEAVLQGSSNK